MLVSYGADANYFNSESKSALTFAARAMCVASIDALLRVGARPNAVLRRNGESVQDDVSDSSDGVRTRTLLLTFPGPVVAVVGVDDGGRGSASVRSALLPSPRPQPSAPATASSNAVVPAHAFGHASAPPAAGAAAAPAAVGTGDSAHPESRYAMPDDFEAELFAVAKAVDPAVASTLGAAAGAAAATVTGSFKPAAAATAAPADLAKKKVLKKKKPAAVPSWMARAAAMEATTAGSKPRSDLDGDVADGDIADAAAEVGDKADVDAAAGPKVGPEPAEPAPPAAAPAPAPAPAAPAPAPASASVPAAIRAAVPPAPLVTKAYTQSVYVAPSSSLSGNVLTAALASGFGQQGLPALWHLVQALAPVPASGYGKMPLRAYMTTSDAGPAAPTPVAGDVAAASSSAAAVAISSSVPSDKLPPADTERALKALADPQTYEGICALRLLLLAGANPNCRNAAGYTPLFECARFSTPAALAVMGTALFLSACCHGLRDLYCHQSCGCSLTQRSYLRCPLSRQSCCSALAQTPVRATPQAALHYMSRAPRGTPTPYASSLLRAHPQTCSPLRGPRRSCSPLPARRLTLFLIRPPLHLRPAQLLGLRPLPSQALVLPSGCQLGARAPSLPLPLGVPRAPARPPPPPSPCTCSTGGAQLARTRTSRACARRWPLATSPFLRWPLASTPSSRSSRRSWPQRVARHP